MRLPRALLTLLAGGLVLAACTAPDETSSTPSPPSSPSSGASADPVAEPVPWWNDEVFYEVFVRSFSDSDGDGIGDLKGLTNKLPYLEDLGVTALWLMPITQSPSYHGYDATDYYTVEEDYGTNDDFRALVAAAHDRGIEVIVDLMLNHTSVEHPWFAESASDPQSPKRDWYVWNDTDPGTRTQWGAPTWHPWGDQYYFGLFWEGMPDLNYRTGPVTEQMYDVARFWLEDMGADGFRLDAVRHLIEDGDQLDGTPETHAWLQAWDDHLDSLDPESLTVGEIWDTTGEVVPYVVDDQVDLAFEFDLAEALLVSVNTGDPSQFADQVRTVLAAYPPGQFAPFLTNHDQNRVMTQLGGVALSGAEKSMLAAGLLLTLPGVPFLYYGEEIGMVGRKPDELIRTPMQWDGTPNAGFTSGTPWQPVNDDLPLVNVAAQSDDPGSLLNRYRTFLAIRASHPALSVGSYQELESSCESVHAALRRTADGTDSVLVVANFSPDEARGCSLGAASSPLPAGSTSSVELVTGRPAADLIVGEGGAIEGYVPEPVLPGRTVLVLALG